MAASTGSHPINLNINSIAQVSAGNYNNYNSSNQNNNNSSTAMGTGPSALFSSAAGAAGTANAAGGGAAGAGPRGRQMVCADCEKALPNQIVFDKIELIIRRMQDEQNGLPVKTAKSFMSKIPSVFTGNDLIQWMMKNLQLDDQQEAIHLANLIASHGYIFPIEDHTLSIKNDCTFYRFQTPCLWPSNNIEPENTDYAVYLCKRTMQGKTRLELADYEAENLARLQKMFSRKWEFIFMQAEAQAKVDKKRDKLERKVLDSQERAFWDVYRPVPGCVNTTEMDIKKACRLSKSAKRCSDCQRNFLSGASSSSAATSQQHHQQQQPQSQQPQPQQTPSQRTPTTSPQKGASSDGSGSGQPIDSKRAGADAAAAPPLPPEAIVEQGRKLERELNEGETADGNNDADEMDDDAREGQVGSYDDDEELDDLSTGRAGGGGEGGKRPMVEPRSPHPSPVDDGSIESSSPVKGAVLAPADAVVEHETRNSENLSSSEAAQVNDARERPGEQGEIEGQQVPQKTPDEELQQQKASRHHAHHHTHHAHHHHHHTPHQHPHHQHHHHPHQHQHHHHPHQHPHHHHHHHHHRQCPHHKQQAAAGSGRQGSATAAASGNGDEAAAANIKAAQVDGDEAQRQHLSSHKKHAPHCSRRRLVGSFDQSASSQPLVPLAAVVSSSSATSHLLPAAPASRRRSECAGAGARAMSMSVSEPAAAESKAATAGSASLGLGEPKVAASRQQSSSARSLAASVGSATGGPTGERPASACSSLASLTAVQHQLQQSQGSAEALQATDRQHSCQQQQAKARKSSLRITRSPSEQVTSSSTASSVGALSGATVIDQTANSGTGACTKQPGRQQSLSQQSSTAPGGPSKRSGHAQLKGAQSVCASSSTGASGVPNRRLVVAAAGSASTDINNDSIIDTCGSPKDAAFICDLERELETLRVRLERRIGGVKMSKVTQSYLSYFKQWAEYDPFIAQPIPSNPWCSDSTELWDSERQTKDVHCRRVRRWAFSLKELLNDPAGREQFYRFLEKEFSAENLKFWDAVQELKRVHSRDVARRVEAIWTEYLAQDANCPINIDSKSYETSKRNMAKNKNNRYIFDEAAGHVYQLMKNDSYPRYLRSDMYKDYKEASERKRTNQVAFDVFKPQITNLKHKFNF